MIWTPATINEMYALLDEGLSWAAVGERMGCSKNCIAGKVRRLGTRPRPVPPPKPEPAPKRRTKPVAVALPTLPSEPVRTCQYPHGHPRTKSFRFCGAPVHGIGGVYCAKHEALCWTGRARAA